MFLFLPASRSLEYFGLRRLYVIRFIVMILSCYLLCFSSLYKIAIKIIVTYLCLLYYFIQFVFVQLHFSCSISQLCNPTSLSEISTFFWDIFMFWDWVYMYIFVYFFFFSFFIVKFSLTIGNLFGNLYLEVHYWNSYKLPDSLCHDTKEHKIKQYIYQDLRHSMLLPNGLTKLYEPYVRINRTDYVSRQYINNLAPTNNVAQQYNEISSHLDPQIFSTNLWAIINIYKSSETHE